MSNRLSEQLADLSVRAKNVEDALVAARAETQERIATRREQARAAAAAAVDRVDRDLQSVGDKLADQWKALKVKVAADIDRLKEDHAQRRQGREIGRAEDRAARLEAEAGVAIDFALASIEDAKLAVLDAVIAERDAADARTS